MRVKITLSRSEFEPTLLTLLSRVMKREISATNVESLTVYYGQNINDGFEATIHCDVTDPTPMPTIDVVDLGPKQLTASEVETDIPTENGQH